MRKIWIIALVCIGSSIFAAFAITNLLPYSNYTLEILNMKDTYYPGEQYTFTTKLSGGSGCGSHYIDYPYLDESKGLAKVLDCVRGAELFKDHPPTFETITSLAPTIPGTYNVTASFEKLKDPVVHEFEVVENWKN